MSKFHQLSGGNSGDCGNGPPRAESIACTKAFLPNSKPPIITSKARELTRLDKKRNEGIIIPALPRIRRSSTGCPQGPCQQGLEIICSENYRNRLEWRVKKPTKRKRKKPG